MPMQHCQSSGRHAVTLFELVMVLAVMVVLTALVYPSAEGLYAEMRVNQAADQVRARWAEARARAMNEGRPYRFAILPGQGNLRLAPDSSDYWSGNASDSSPRADGTDPPLVVDETLPPTIRFALGADTAIDAQEGSASHQPVGSVVPGAWRTLATFLPDGTAREDLELLIHGPHARPVLLRLRGLTATATSERR